MRARSERARNRIAQEACRRGAGLADCASVTAPIASATSSTQLRTFFQATELKA
jgi:hypothetical protein